MMSVQIIAEAGVNHNGSLDLAIKLIDAAVDAGVDIIKFQTFNPVKLVSKNAAQAKYQQENSAYESQLKMLEALALPFESFVILRDYCNQKSIQFLSTPFDLESIDFLQSIDVSFWKVPSGEITNLPYLLKIAKTGKDIVLSTGMSNTEEIKNTIKILGDNGAGKITLLHCNTEYPTPMEDVNLNAMLTLKNEFDTDVGYSDHTKGIEIPIAAVAMGAVVIEKHFTLDKNMEGPDHKASLEPHELKEMVTAIRNIEKAMGNGVKAPSLSEKKNIDVARKSIVAKKKILKGEMFSEENITVKRPGNGISPMSWFEVLGIAAVKDFEEDELIEL